MSIEISTQWIEPSKPIELNDNAQRENSEKENNEKVEGGGGGGEDNDVDEGKKLNSSMLNVHIVEFITNRLSVSNLNDKGKTANAFSTI